MTQLWSTPRDAERNNKHKFVTDLLQYPLHVPVQSGLRMD